MIIIDAKDTVIGRVATVAAKRALLNEHVAVVNCREAVMTGGKKRILDDWKRKREMGVPKKGPYIHRTPEKFVRRIIRGMLPFKKPRGAEAFKRIKCYSGEPKLDGERIIIKEAQTRKLPNAKYLTVGEICKALGGKHGEE